MLNLTLSCLPLNGYKIVVDILTGENLSSIQVANMDIFYWSVRSFSRRGGNGIGNVVSLDSCRFHVNRIHENLVQHPSNIISILPHIIFICAFTPAQYNVILIQICQNCPIDFKLCIMIPITIRYKNQKAMQLCNRCQKACNENMPLLNIFVILQQIYVQFYLDLKINVLHIKF